MKSPLRNWHTTLLPGLSITGLVILARLFGILQPLEWRALDAGLKWRPPEAPDPRVTLIAITEDDIQTALGYPISDQALAELIETLQTYDPRTIGIDIFRDEPVGEGHSRLLTALTKTNNVVAINKIHGATVAPPANMPEAQVGFVDANLDSDGFLRRTLLADQDDLGDYRFSLTIRLVEQYLAPEGIVLENGIRDPETMRFGATEIPRFQPNTGGYVRTDNGGNQALINFRGGEIPFEKISYKDLMAGQVNPHLLQDRAVLVGYTAESVKDFVSSGAIASNSPSLIPGVDIQAHAVSQILSAFYDHRPFLKALPNRAEYWLILTSGLLGMALAYWRRKPAIHLLALIAVSVGGLSVCYALLVASWWLPVVPMTVAFLLNAAALYPFYQAQAQLRSQLNERQQLIDWTYNTIHNGPLQIAANMLSLWPAQEPAPNALRTELLALNQELRGIYEAMRQEMLSPNKQLVITGQRMVDLEVPLNELLYETYRATLERRHSFFAPMLKITRFETMVDSDLSPAQKRNLARFLEEALINVYKYAKGTTRLTINCCQEGSNNLIQIRDNDDQSLPPNPPSVQGGYGTQQAKKLARQLSGQFKRDKIDPQGTGCELRWPTSLPAWQRWLR